MGWLRRLANRFDSENRVSSRDPYLAEMFGMRAAGGQIVSADRAEGIPAVHACVQAIAETTASLPLNVYRRTDDGGRMLDRAHPLSRVLHDQANQVQTALELREQLVASVLLTGNGYARKVLDGRGAVAELVPLHPSRVRPERLVNGRIRYEYQSAGGGVERLVQDEVLHLRYRSKDGFTGLSPITIARETIGTALAQQETEAALHRNGVRLSGALKLTGHLASAEAFTRLKTDFEKAFSGSARTGRVLILEDGAEWVPLSMTLADAQFVESRKLTVEDIARIFRIPPPAIGVLDKATYSNIQELGRWLVMHTLRPWLVRIEQAMNASLLTADGRRTHFIEHNFEGLLRGSQKERFEAYRIGREWGWLSANEIRGRENMNPVEGGDEFRSPMNSEPVG